jgi:arsenite-transporting ATPase
MAWMRIGELAEEHAESMLVVDTAPTGHTLRMLSSSNHFRQMAGALDAMQEKHRDMVRQFTRRDVRDALDAFIDDFDAAATRRRELLTDPARAAFVPVTLSERWVVEQTKRLVAEVRAEGLDIPFAILNRAVVDADCDRDRTLAAADAEARTQLGTVVDAPRSCTPLDSAERIADWLSASATRNPQPATTAPAPSDQRPAPLRIVPPARLLFLAGKGGVGKTTTAASVALQLAAAHPDQRLVAISVDPAHTLPAVFAIEAPPPNLTIEAIDTRARWRTFRDSIGVEIERAVDAITPRGMSVAHDTEALRKLIEVAPPGADELFAITRLADLLADDSVAAIVVDTAPTGHFLRLLDLPRTAGEWVREFIRILLRYRDLVPAGSLGEELVRASRSLHALDGTLHSEAAAVVVVTRPERIVVAETERLIAELRRREVRLAGVVANAVTPANDCPCDRAMRAYELEELARLGDGVVVVERRDTPPASLTEIAALLHFGA